MLVVVGRNVAPEFQEMLATDLRGAELVVLLLTFLWGFALALPGDAFRLDAYREFQAVGVTEVELGGAMMGVGVLMLVGLLAGFPWLRRLALLEAVALWSFMSVFFRLSHSPGAAVYLTSSLGFVSLACFFHLRYREIRPGRQG